MAIKTDFEFKGIKVVDGYLKVGNLNLNNYPSKQWIASIHKHASKNNELLDGSETISFDYVKGEDPMEKAYILLADMYQGECV
ncbi:hypothetical protein ACTA57_002908 [Vibrio parahaemolyticus]|nr:hypothetical protein [Vibrio parahaemolyticus]